MTDLLVRLYDLPETPTRLPEGVIVRRALGPERRQVAEWVDKEFGSRWSSECEVAFSGHPIAVWIATRAGKIIGFSAHDGVAKGFFGPTGVLESERGKGIGDALLIVALRGMREAGYAYAIVGWAGPIDFYKKRVGAIEIPDSTPGAYKDLLLRD